MSRLPITIVVRDGKKALTLDVRRMIVSKMIETAINDVNVDPEVGAEGKYWVMADAAALAAVTADAALSDFEESADFVEAVKEDGEA